MGDRNELQKVADASASAGTPGSYAHSIGWVNFAMQKLGVGLSGRQQENMHSSMSLVDSGRMTNAQASAREGRYFAGDAVNPELPPRDRLGAVSGVLANSLLGPAFHYQTDLNNYNMGRGLSKEVRAMMHAHSSGDNF